VHQVVGDVDTVAGARERLGTENVPHVDLEALPEQPARTNAVAVADQTAHLIAALAESAGETPADEAAGACDEEVHGNPNLAEAGKPTPRTDASSAPCERLDRPERTA
jgi:hypothetical protein